MATKIIVEREGLSSGYLERLTGEEPPPRITNFEKQIWKNCPNTQMDCPDTQMDCPEIQTDFLDDKKHWTIIWKNDPKLSGFSASFAHRLQNNRFSRPTTPELATVSVFSEGQSSVTPSYSSGGRRFQPSGRRSTKPATSTESEKSYTSNKRSFKSKIGASNVENNVGPSSSTYKFKLSRPSGRWQYKTSPKPRVTIRRQDDNMDNVTVSPIPQFTPDIQLEGTDQELSGSGLFPALQHEDNSIVHDVTPSLTAETLRVEISTPADFKDVYYEIATIKTPYSFQVSSVKIDFG